MITSGQLITTRAAATDEVTSATVSQKHGGRSISIEAPICQWSAKAIVQLTFQLLPIIATGANAGSHRRVRPCPITTSGQPTDSRLVQ